MPSTATTTDSPAPGLPTYRAYYLDPTGSIRSVVVIEAEDDEVAKVKAQSLVNGHGVDLWERARFLASFPPLLTAPKDD